MQTRSQTLRQRVESCFYGFRAHLAYTVLLYVPAVEKAKGLYTFISYVDKNFEMLEKVLKPLGWWDRLETEVYHCRRKVEKENVHMLLEKKDRKEFVRLIYKISKKLSK